MKVVTKRKWLDDGSYVEVRFQSNWSQDGLGKLDVYWFTSDPRKKQHRKPKFWSRSSTHGVVDRAIGISDWFHWSGSASSDYRKYVAAALELLKELRLTSSVGRAPAAMKREVVGLNPASGFNPKPRGIPYSVEDGSGWLALTAHGILDAGEVG